VTVLRQSREGAIRGRYRLAAIVYLVLGLVVMGLTHLPGMEKALPLPFLAEWRVPVAVAAMFIATAMIWGAHRWLTWLISLFPLYRLIMLAVNATTANHLELRPDPTTVLPPSLTDVAAWQAFIQAEMASSTPFYEFEKFVNAAAHAPGPLAVYEFKAALISWLGVVLLAIVVLTLWRAARKKA